MPRAGTVGCQEQGMLGALVLPLGSFSFLDEVTLTPSGFLGIPSCWVASVAKWCLWHPQPYQSQGPWGTGSSISHTQPWSALILLLPSVPPQTLLCAFFFCTSLLQPLPSSNKTFLTSTKGSNSTFIFYPN